MCEALSVKADRGDGGGVLYGEMILFKYLPFVTPPDCCTFMLFSVTERSWSCACIKRCH